MNVSNQIQQEAPKWNKLLWLWSGSALFVFVVIVIGSFEYQYKVSVTTAKDYYNRGLYSKAYEEVSGLKVKERDRVWIEELHVIMKLYQPYERYLNSHKEEKDEIGMALLATVMKRYDALMDQELNKEVKKQLTTIYETCLMELKSVYGVSKEEVAS